MSKLIICRIILLNFVFKIFVMTPVSFVFILLVSLISLNSVAQERGNWRLYRAKKDTKTTDAENQLAPNETLLYTDSIQVFNGPGKVNVFEDYRMAQLIDKYIEAHENGTIPGFRVQLFFGDRDQARETKAAFLKRYPHIRADVTYLAPNFRVRVGNFRTILEAEKFKAELKKNFPNCYIVTERIPLPKL